MIDVDKNIDRIIKDKTIANEHKSDIINLLTAASKITFGKEGRTEGYRYKDVFLPRCTSVLRMDGTKADGLMIWAKREVAQHAKDRLSEVLNEKGSISQLDISLICQEALANPDKQRDDAANVGSDKHDKIEHWLNNQDEVPSDDIKDFVDVWKKENVTLIATEMPIAFLLDEDYDIGFGGKLDILAYKDGELIIYDNKTSKALHNGYGIQTAAYRAAVNQMIRMTNADALHCLRVEKAKIIHMPDIEILSEAQFKAFKKKGMLVECTNLDDAFIHFTYLLRLYYRRNNKYLC